MGGCSGCDNDEVATSSGTIIGSSTGSFPAISGLTSEVGGQAPPYNAACLTGDGTPNCYSLQLNSQTYSCNTGYTNGFTVPQCWEQFVSSNTGELYIQFWLIGYCGVSGGSNCGDSPPFTSSNPAPSFSCPSTGIPSGSSWMQSGGNCYANSAMVSPPSTAATSLGTLSLMGFANFMGSGNDVIQLCISGGSCYMVTLADNVLDLYNNWLDSEFNVYGDASGSQAVFNAGTSIQVSTTITDQSGSPIAASCNSNEYTGESNNLWMGPCTGGLGGITFTEASETFSLSSAETDVTVLAGQTGTYSIGTTLTQGTAAPITLSVVSGLPSGATSSFATNPVTPSGSSDLTIATSPGVLGDYTLTIQAQFGALVETITVNLHIYDFTVGIEPSDLTVLRGASAVYDLSLTLVPGSSTIGIPGISMAVSGSPPDATFTLSATSIIPTVVGCTISTLPDCQFVTVATAGPPGGSLGDFAFHVTGTDPDPSGGSRSGGANL
ncbi:MAG: hypothetical protein OK442_03585, partial [Thaumarchaeota archaeon]|nr:hypothetical protein [Nitrososphaerota archaeon]